MHHRRFKTYFNTLWTVFFIFCFLPFTLHASFIESTMGTAVVNDATATYHNPAALTLLKSTQFIALGSLTAFNSHFSGQSQSDLNQSGHANTHAKYYLPSLYVSTSIQDKFKCGMAVLSNMLNSKTDETSILRYTIPSTKIQNLDIIPAVGIKLTDHVSLGAGLTYSSAQFVSNPITGFPNLNLADVQSHHVTRSNSYGGNAGFVIKLSPSTLLGFDYRSALSYQFHGTSYFKGIPTITSDHYNFNFWTPARSVLTISHFMTPEAGMIATVQYIQWSIFDKITVHNIATQVDTQSIILPQAVIPYHFHDTWMYTLGGIKNITSACVIRVAGTYEQSPGNGYSQITSGDSMVIGASMGYEIYKNTMIDGSYAHAFMKNRNINIASKTSTMTGINQCAGDSVSVKLTVSMS